MIFSDLSQKHGIGLRIRTPQLAYQPQIAQRNYSFGLCVVLRQVQIAGGLVPDLKLYNSVRVFHLRANTRLPTQGLVPSDTLRWTYPIYVCTPGRVTKSHIDATRSTILLKDDRGSGRAEGRP